MSTYSANICPCCNNSGGVFQSSYVRCLYCGHRWRKPPESTRSVHYYESLEARNDLRAPWFERKITDRFALLDRLIKQMGVKRLLEVGCAEGELGYTVKSCFDLVYEGIELSRDSLVAGQKLDKVFTVPAQLIQSELYGLIVSFHVLEHIEDLGSELTAWRNLLIDGGRILIEVPNQSGHVLLAEDKNIEHLHQFTTASLSMLLARNGFDCLELTTGHYESPVYSDSIRVLARPNQSFDKMQDLLLKRFNAVFNGPFLVYGVGGDFENYVAPILNDLPVEALLDTSPHKWGLAIGKYTVENYDESKHGVLPILVCSIRYSANIKDHLLRLGIVSDRIIGLESVY